MQKKAYSYTRFSTAIQSKGHSIARQSEASDKYIEKHNLLLVDSIHDYGVSAFTGDNTTNGALSEFIKLVKAGKIEEGSVLILEDLDRLTRQEVLKALSLFIELLSFGIEIATTNDGITYTKDNMDSGQLMFSIMSLTKAHHESDKKSKRGKEVWDAKRKLALEEKKPLTRQCPRWLTVSDDMQSFIVNKERVKVIRDIFTMSIGGTGQRKIASMLNRDGVAPFTLKKMWNYAYIGHLIKNRALLGEFQPKHKGEPVGEVIQDYYPRILTEDLFYRAQGETKKRLSPSSAGRKGIKFSNLFTGMCKCSNCNETFRLISSKDTAYLTCSNNYMAAGCTCSKRWRYRHVEAMALVALNQEHDWFSTVGSQNKRKVEVESTLNALNAKLSETQRKLNNYLSLFEMATESSLSHARSNYLTAVNEDEAIKSDIKRLKKESAEYTPKTERFEAYSTAVWLLKTETDPHKLYMLRTQVNNSLRSLGVTLYFDENSVTAELASNKQRITVLTAENEKGAEFASNVTMLPFHVVQEMTAPARKADT